MIEAIKGLSDTQVICLAVVTVALIWGIVQICKYENKVDKDVS